MDRDSSRSSGVIRSRPRACEGTPSPRNDGDQCDLGQNAYGNMDFWRVSLRYLSGTRLPSIWSHFEYERLDDARRYCHLEHIIAELESLGDVRRTGVWR